MATTITTFTPSPIQLAYQSPFNVQDSWQSPIPRSELVFSIVAGAVPVEAGGKDQRVNVNCDLPAGLGYVMTDCAMDIAGVDATDWDVSAVLNLKDDTAASTALWRYHYTFTSVGVVQNSTTAKARIYSINKPLSKVFVPRKGAAGARLQAGVMNLTVDGSLMTVDFFARFLVFEFNQALLWSVNTPIPVR